MIEQTGDHLCHPLLPNGWHHKLKRMMIKWWTWWWWINFYKTPLLQHLLSYCLATCATCHVWYSHCDSLSYCLPVVHITLEQIFQHDTVNRLSEEGFASECSHLELYFSFLVNFCCLLMSAPIAFLLHLSSSCARNFIVIPVNVFCQWQMAELNIIKISSQQVNPALYLGHLPCSALLS